MTEQVFIVPYDKTTDIPHGFNKQKHCLKLNLLKKIVLKVKINWKTFWI